METNENKEYQNLPIITILLSEPYKPNKICKDYLNGNFLHIFLNDEPKQALPSTLPPLKFNLI